MDPVEMRPLTLFSFLLIVQVDFKKETHMKILLKLLVLSVLMVSCKKQQDAAQDPIKPTVVKNIVRVMMHQPNEFTFLVRNPNNNKLGQLKISAAEVNILADQDGEIPISIEYECRSDTCKEIPQNFSRWYTMPKKLTIHLHSAKEINGAGWSTGGKNSQSGQTTILE